MALIQSVLTPLEGQVLGVAANLPGLSIDPQTIANIINGQPSASAGGQIQVEGEWVIIGGVRLKRRDGAAAETSAPAAAPDTAPVEAAIEHLKALGLLHANSPRLRIDAGLREFWQGLGDRNAINDRLLVQLLFDQTQTGASAMTGIARTNSATCWARSTMRCRRSSGARPSR